jgi:hypothetical protein
LQISNDTFAMQIRRAHHVLPHGVGQNWWRVTAADINRY